MGTLSCTTTHRISLLFSWRMRSCGLFGLWHKSLKPNRFHLCFNVDPFMSIMSIFGSGLVSTVIYAASGFFGVNLHSFRWWLPAFDSVWARRLWRDGAGEGVRDSVLWWIQAFSLTRDHGSSALNRDPGLGFWKSSGGGCPERGLRVCWWRQRMRSGRQVDRKSVV